MPGKNAISVLVIDHNPVLLEGIACLIRVEPDLLLVGTASNLRDGQEMALRAGVDCVVIDLDIQPGMGFEVLGGIRKVHPGAIIIGLITYELDDLASDALGAGVSAVLGKDQISQDLVGLIRKHSPSA